jgi:branched-chain amino acid transport system ATP-binding protein
MPPSLEVEGLSVARRRIPVVHALSFNLRKGDCLALLGANGAGKTSAVEGMAGLLPKASGTIRLHEADITRLSASEIARKGLSLVPQWRDLFPSFTIEETLQAALNAGAARGRRRFEDIYELFPKLASRRGQTAGTLSGGEQQMLAIGRALATEPSVLVLDEPTAGLAAGIVSDLVCILQAIRRRGMTVLLVEQNISVAAAVAEDCIVLATGRAVWRGAMSHAAESEEVRRSYFGAQLASSE